jgi:hypothetical protein
MAGTIVGGLSKKKGPLLEFVFRAAVNPSMDAAEKTSVFFTPRKTNIAPLLVRATRHDARDLLSSGPQKEGTLRAPKRLAPAPTCRCGVDRYLLSGPPVPCEGRSPNGMADEEHAELAEPLMRNDCLDERDR